MKRFFPLLLGLTLICLSFNNINVDEPLLPEECDTSSEFIEDDAAISLIKICSYHAVPSSSQNSCPSVAAQLKILPDCKGSVAAGLMVTNLVSNPIIGDKYPLPFGTEPIYFEYTVFGTTYKLGPIDSFAYRDDMLDHNFNSFHIYEAEIELLFDLSTICPAQMPSFFFDARVIDADDFTYDIGSNAGVTDIFYCGLFQESCNYCSNLPNGCLPNTPGHELEYDNIMACGNDCGSCLPPRTLTKKETINLESSHSKTASQTNTNGSNENESTSPKFVMESSEDISMQTAPNPFTDEITLLFNKKVDIIESLQVFDMTGRNVVLKENLNLNGRQLTLDTNDLTPGAYFCKVIVENKILTKKIIKL